jgi:heme exporter protein D
MDEAGARTVTTTVGALYRSLHESIREQVRGMDHGTLNWKPLPLANSLAVLVVHTLAAERDALSAVRMVTNERDREAEFKAEAEEADLLALIDKTDIEVSELVGAMTSADLTEMRPRPGRDPKPGLEWLLSNYGHSREHLAQIALTKQLYDSRT